VGKLNMIKPKPTIRAIVYSEEKLKLIGKKLANPILSEYRKKEYIRRFVGEHCAICHEVPTKIVCYDMGGISLVEKYCDKCIGKIKMT
jgi:hypothetical protein